MGLIVDFFSPFHLDACEAFGNGVGVKSARYVTIVSPCVVVQPLVLLCQWCLPRLFFSICGIPSRPCFFYDCEGPSPVACSMSMASPTISYPFVFSLSSVQNCDNTLY